MADNEEYVERGAGGLHRHDHEEALLRRLDDRRNNENRGEVENPLENLLRAVFGLRLVCRFDLGVREAQRHRLDANVLLLRLPPVRDGRPATAAIERGRLGVDVI
jgi:hypothetical protein